MTIKSLKNSESTSRLKEDNHRHCKMGFASQNLNNTIRFIVSRVQLSNSCKSSYTNAKQCKMYGNLFVAKRGEKFVLK